MAQEEALSAEAACKHASEIRAVNVDSSAPNIHHMSSKRQTYKQANVCASCGGQHNRALCRFKNAVCRCCQKAGHIERVCRSKQRRSKPQAKANAISVADTHQSYLLNRISCQSTPSVCSLKLSVFLSIEGKTFLVEVDSGSDVTIISEQTFEYLRNNKKLKLAPMTLSLVSFLGKQVKLMGSCLVNVDYSVIHTRLRIFVAKGNCPNLLGLEWFKPLGIRIEGINHINSSPVELVLRKYQAVFTPNLGCYTGEPVSLDLDPSVPPIRMKARKVPFALKEKIDMELDKLVKQKVLEPVSHPVWATPIVTPMKPDGSVRICGDYKCTINKALLKHAYPVPAVSHLLASLAGGKVFAKLDLAQAYQQLVVDKKTADAQTIITHRGAFRVKRLQFGVSAAPGIFQGLIDQLTKGIPGVLPYFDDILIAAKDESILAKRLATLLKRFYDAGLRLNAEKCKFCLRRIEFLGFDIDVSGIHPSKQKVAAIHNTPQPRNKKELQTFLGLLNFYHSFLRNKATVAEPLHRLLDKETKWKWTNKHKKAFNQTKQLLSSDCVLTHYDVKKPLVLICDASPVGIGAVLCHQMPNGKEAPIAFYSRTLTSTERNYAQIDKEALAIIASVKKFHDYLYGRSFRIITDHKPLLGIFAPNKETPYILSPRMLRWTVMLGAYVYDICYRPGKLIANADILSRLPTKVPDVEIPPPLEVLMLESDDAVIMKANDIARMSLKDPVISRVLNWAWKGWPAKLSDEKFKPFFSRQLEISVHKGCLLWGNRNCPFSSGIERTSREDGPHDKRGFAKNGSWKLETASSEFLIFTAGDTLWHNREKFGRTANEALIANGHSDVTKPDIQKIRIFAPDDLVFARNYAHGPKWCPATIVAPTGPVSYKVRTNDGQLWKRHLDQLGKQQPSIEVTEDIEADVSKTQQSNIADNLSQTEQEDCQQLMEKSPSAVVEPIAEHISEAIAEPITEPVAEQPTRPPRTRRKPKWMEDYVV
ncbi:Transposon Tf2-6 polyprotein [Trichinella sp. T6]|nr:Transposon Tf2-6 polyprotein [Trichinella sp. T6]